MLTPELETIEIDLEQTTMVDSCGLGALVSLYRAALRRNLNGGVRMRLLNPQPPVQQLFELTRMHQLFEIVPPAGIVSPAGRAVPGPAAIPQPVSPAQPA